MEHQEDIRLLTEFAAETGLQVSAVDAGKRLVKLSGPASKMQEAFGTTLAIYRDDKHQFRGREGVLRLPEDLHAVVEAVLGLDTRQAAQPHFVQVAQAAQPAAITGHRPNAVGALYSFPTSVTGAGQCIGIVELGGGFVASDNTTAFAAMGLATPQIVAVSVDGGQNAPGDPADGEVALDIQTSGGVAPGARIAVYFAPNTFQGFADAITAAVHDTANKPDVISISWGTAEINWADQARQVMDNALQDAGTLGVSVFVAAGDHLATDGIPGGGVHVDYPASSPSAIGCGGTTIDTTGNTINNEVVWNEGASGWGTGGGISDKYLTVPAFQQGANLPVNVSTGKKGRGVPDVAGDAAQESGYTIVLHGQTVQIGGTSAVAPLWAGLTALINQAAPSPIGFFLPKLYQNPQLLRVITQGNNKVANTNLGYTAGNGWSACTGLGVPIGTALLQAFAGQFSWTGDFTGSGKTETLFWLPGDKNYWLGQFTGNQLTYTLAGNTAGFAGGEGVSLFWTGDFTGSGKTETLFWFPGDKNYWLGQFTGNQLGYTLAGNTAGFSGGESVGRIWVGNFTGSGHSQLLFYSPGDGNWWLGSFSGTQLLWALVLRGFVLDQH
jgi:kumamolisin